MNNHKFKIGDTVQLNSGSPMMTIKNIESNIIECTWFDGKKIYSDKFNIDMISLSSYSPLAGKTI